ncbi:hypothetical protein WN943_015116 [Citrus x changshan-huyou]
MMCNRPREWKLRTNGDETAVMTELEFTRAKVGPWMIVSRKGSERPGLLVMGNNMNPMGYPPDMGDLEMENLDDQLHDSEYMEDSKMTRARRMRLSWRTKML